MPIVISFLCDKSELEKIVKKVLELKFGSEHLKMMSENFSCEKGFELPLTSEWTEKIRMSPMFDPFMIELLKRHNARQLRFVTEGNNLIGLRLKDNLPYWSKEELEELTHLLFSIGINANITKDAMRCI